jgi:hypothetical protein
MLQGNICIAIYINKIYGCKFYGTRLFEHGAHKKNLTNARDPSMGEHTKSTKVKVLQ